MRPGHVLLAVVLAVTLSAPSAPAAGPATVTVAAGRASVQPSGAARSLEVTGTFQLYEGDRLRPGGGASVTVTLPGKPAVPLRSGTTYGVAPAGLVELPSGRVAIAFDAAPPAPADPSAPGSPPPPDAAPPLAGAVTPVDGEVHLQESGWTHWIPVPHRTSFSWGASVHAAPHARFQIATADGLVLRGVGPASLTLESGSVTIRSGLVLVQASPQRRGAVVVTPAATVNLTGTLLEVAHDEGTSTTTLHVLEGVAALASPAGAPGRTWSRYLSARRSIMVPVQGQPSPPSRFEPRDRLTRFTEGWKPEGPGSAFLPDWSEEDLLRQLRADQQPLERQPPPVPGTEAKGGPSWLRLRMQAMESPANRRHYMAFRRYMEARERRERAEEAVAPAVADAASAVPQTEDHLPGGPTTNRDEGKLRLLRWHERRMAKQLADLELDLANQDWETGLDPWILHDSLSVRRREALYGEDLRMQTRRMIRDTRTTLADFEVRVADINSQITTLSGIPGSEAAIAALVAERSRILHEADQLKDTVEELIEHH